jgi:hypothetical protein
MRIKRNKFYYGHRLGERQAPVQIWPERSNDLKKALLALERSKTIAQTVPEFAPTSERAYRVAKKWVLWVNYIYGNLWTPYIAIPGTGGIIAEWRYQDNVVSVSFDGDEDEIDIVHSDLNGIENSTIFSEPLLREYLNAITASQYSPSGTSDFSYIPTGITDFTYRSA